MSQNEIPITLLQALHSLLQLVDKKDPETASHCLRVGRDSKLLAQAAGLDLATQTRCEFAGVCHDFGKVGIADEILLKPGKLTSDEYRQMMAHPMISVEMLKPLAHFPFIESILPGVQHHHERYDGAGYPNRLSGRDIPLEARVILIADTFDAMTVTRSYRKGLTAETAFQELLLYAGKQFDPTLAAVYVQAKPNWKKQESEIFRELETLHKAA